MKKALALMLAAAMLFSLLTSCETAPVDSSDGPKVLNYGFVYDPSSMDPQNTTDSDTAALIQLANEGLVRNRNGRIEPGIAHSWDVSEDMYEYTFYLRESTWADGTPLTAHDFEYSFLRMFDVQSAYEQAESHYALFENAKEYHTEEISDISLVGVKALDDYTLYVKVAEPNSETLHRFSRYAMFPLKKDVAEAAGMSYGQEADKFASNGPFKLTSWTHHEKLVFEKNENYWNKDEVKLDGINIVLGAENQTGADMMLSGNIDIMATTNADVMQQLVDGGFKMFSYTSNIQSLLFGSKEDDQEDLMGNFNFRLALNLVINRQALTDAIIKGRIPATRISTPTTLGVDGYFVDEYPYEGWPPSGDAEKARYHLNLAMEELGMKVEDIPELFILCYDSASNLLLIQAIQDMLLKELGIKSVIDNVPIQQMFAKVNDGDFNLWWSGLPVGTVDWASPDGFLQSFDWRNPGYTGTWRDDEFARLFDIVKTTTDLKERKDSLFEIEKLLIETNPPIVIVAYTQVFVLYRDTFTEPEFTGRHDITFVDMK